MGGDKREIRKIGHNFKEEYRAFLPYGVQPKGVVFDTMIAAYLINPSKDTYTIDELSTIYLGEFASSEIEVLGSGSKKMSLLDLSPERRTLYAASLTQIVYRVYPKMKQELADKGMERLFYDVELPLVEVLASMEQIGIKVNVPVLNEIGHFLAGELTKLTESSVRAAGAAGAEENEIRVFDFRGGAGEVEPSSSYYWKHFAFPAIGQATVHLRGRVGSLYPPGGWKNPFPISADRYSHRAIVQYGSKSTEYSHPYGTGTAAPKGLRAGKQ